MPFGANSNFEILTATQAITSAAEVHLSPEKDTAGVVASKGVDRQNARHPGSIYHPLFIGVQVDAVVATAVSVDFDSGDGLSFDYDIVAPTNMAPFVSGPNPSDGIIFNLDSTHPGLLIFPKGTRAAPDSLRVFFAASIGEVVSVTFMFEILP